MLLYYIRVLEWQCLYGDKDVRDYHKSFAKFISASEKASAEAEAKVSERSRPRFTQPVFHIKHANRPHQKPDENPQSRILTRNLVKIDLKKAPLQTLMEIPGVDEALAKIILKKRVACTDLNEFQNKTRTSVFSKKKGIQFSVGLLGRKLMKLTFNGSKLSDRRTKSVREGNVGKEVVARASVEPSKVMPEIPTSPGKRGA